jgi:hypothetical protein
MRRASADFPRFDVADDQGGWPTATGGSSGAGREPCVRNPRRVLHLARRQMRLPDIG